MSCRNARNRNRKRKSEEELRKMLEEQLERQERIQMLIKFEKLERDRKRRFEKFERSRKLEDERQLLEQERHKKIKQLEDQRRLEEKLEVMRQNQKLEEERLARVIYGIECFKKVVTALIGFFGIWFLVFCACIFYDAMKFENLSEGHKFIMEHYDQTTYGKGLKYFQKKIVDEFTGEPIFELCGYLIKRFYTSVYAPFREYMGVPDDEYVGIYLFDTFGKKFCYVIDEVLFSNVTRLVKTICNIVVFIFHAVYIMTFEVVITWWIEE